MAMAFGATGLAYAAGRTLAVTWQKGKMTTLTPTSGTSCNPAVTSDTGLVAGTTANTSSATVWRIPAGE